MEVEYNNLVYGSTEAAFQAQKNLDVAEVFTHLSPKESKKYGKTVTLRKDWEENKLQIMYEVCKAKFVQHSDLSKKLIETNPNRLVEGNRWHDNYYGECFCDRCILKIKHNHLGKILMRIRSELINS